MCLSYERVLVPILPSCPFHSAIFGRILLNTTIKIIHHIFANYVKMFGVNGVKMSGAVI
jgi:hypothetical protein